MAQFPSTTTADGIWTLKKVRRAVLGDNWPPLVYADDFFKNTVLLLQADDFADASQNNTFLDASTNTHTITRNGNVTQGSFSPFSQDEGKWGNYFDGVGDYLSTPTGEASLSLPADFTINMWVYISSSGTYEYQISSGGYYTLGKNGNWYFGATDSRITFTSYDGRSNQLVVEAVVSNALNEWIYISAVRSGSTLTLYKNGVSVSSGAFSRSLIDGQASGLQIGRLSVYGDFHGYISGLEIIKGQANVPSGVPTTPASSTVDTSLLTCQSNRFVDNSSNAHSLTVNGDPEVAPFSPFAPSTVYDPATKGGSGYFDNIGDYLSAAHDSSYNFGSGAFTVEAWVWFDDISTHAEAFIIGLYGSNANRRSWLLSRLNSDIRFRYSADGSAATAINLGTTLKLNTWYHIAVTRDSSSDVRIFLNGVPNTATNVTTTFYNNTVDPILIGDTGAGSIYAFNGYIADARVVTGNAVYTSAFTPPTAPLSTLSGTELLCNFTNAGIYDGTGRNVLETVGNAQVDTAVAKYGTGSMKFDGTGDYLVVPHSPTLDFGTGDFTVEFWTSLPTVGTTDYAFLNRSTGSSEDFWIQYRPVYNASNPLHVSVTSSGYSPVAYPWLPNANQWYHIAVTREGTNLKVFVDGTQIGTTQTNSADVSINGADLYIGFNKDANGQALNGYIDDLRITKGVARYTANFTPPAAKLEQQ